MTTITVGAVVQTCLAGISEPTELRSSEGLLLGYFTPIPPAVAPLYDDAKRRFDPELLRRRAEHDGPWHSTAEVMNRIESTRPTE